MWQIFNKKTKFKKQTFNKYKIIEKIIKNENFIIMSKIIFFENIY